MEKFYLEVFYLRVLLWEGKKDTGKNRKENIFYVFSTFLSKWKPSSSQEVFLMEFGQQPQILLFAIPQRAGGM